MSSILGIRRRNGEVGGLGRWIRRWKWKAWGRGVVSEPGACSYTCCAVRICPRPPLSGAVHSLPLPPFGLGAVDQTRIRPARPGACCRVPRALCPGCSEGRPLLWHTQDWTLLGNLACDLRWLKDRARGNPGPGSFANRKNNYLKIFFKLWNISYVSSDSLKIM